MKNTKEFKELLIKLVKEGKPNMGRNQVIDQIETAYKTYELIKHEDI